MKHIYTCLIISLLVLGCKSTYRQVQLEELHSRWVKVPLYLKFEPRNAYPTSGGLVNLTSGYYSLEISGDTVNFHLPFYGRGYHYDMDNPGYDIEHGLLSDLKIKKNIRKESSFMTFDVIKEGKTYAFRLEFWDNGSAYLDLSSMQKSKISYDGHLQEQSFD